MACVRVLIYYCIYTIDWEIYIVHKRRYNIYRKLTIQFFSLMYIGKRRYNYIYNNLIYKIYLI